MRLLLSSWFGGKDWRHSRAQPTARFRSSTTTCSLQTSTAWSTRKLWSSSSVCGMAAHISGTRSSGAYARFCVLSFCLLALAGQPNSGTAQTWSHDACDAVAFCRSEIVVSNLSACFSSSLQSDVGFRLQRLIEMSRSGPRSINQTERAITPNGVATNALLSRRRNVITASGGGRRNCALSLRLQEVQRNRMPVRPFPVFVSTPQGDLPQSLVQHPRLRCAG